MTDDLQLEAAPPRRRGTGGSFEGYSRRARLLLSVATGLAGAGAFAGAAMVTDAQVQEGEEAFTVTSNAREVAVLVPASSATGFAAAGGTYGITEWALATREAVLGSWGAVDRDPDAAGDEEAVVEADWLVHDPRRADPGAPVFTDPCLGEGAGGCPTDRAVRGVILEGRELPPNEVQVHAFPAGDVDGGQVCDFADLGDDEVPLAVVTANPGDVQVVAGGVEVVVSTSDEERREWDDWMRRPVGVRPQSSFVFHCLAMPRPPDAGLFEVIANASDDEDQLATARTWVGGLGDDLAPLTVTPIDSTMARVDVALPGGRGEATVVAVPRSLLGGITSCDRVDDAVAAAADGWRVGATVVTAAEGGAERPWTAELPRVQRTTVPLWEGEPNLVCVDAGSGPSATSTSFWVTPPDARRLVLGITQVQLQAELAGAPIVATARFAELGWTPCAVELAGPAAGITDPGSAGVLCSSGGDIGPLDGAGSVVELAVGVGTGTRHTGRIVLSARPDELDDVESYRLPIPVPGLRGALCVPGAEAAGCLPADATNIVGTIVVSARWNGGAAGDPGWTVEPA